jgi:mannitol/fructose-specific phosphotransferase system IIA component (Ntr-type)
MISLSAFVRPELALDLPAVGSRRALFELLADRMLERGIATDRDELVEAFLRREEACSTGVGHGVALPHASTASARRVAVVVARLAAPVDWQARDGEPVRLALAIASPPELRALYLQVLSSLARALHDESIRGLVLDAASPQQAAEIIANCAQERDESEEKPGLEKEP